MKDLLQSAIHFANQAHWGQYRKYVKDMPYITHPLRVLGAASLIPNIPIYVLAAYVNHDVLEDCPVTYDQLSEVIGVPAANIVRELTNPSKGSEESRAVRKKMDRDHLASVHERLSLEDAKWVWIGKLLDRNDNLNDMMWTCKDVKFMSLYLSESEQLYSAIMQAAKEKSVTIYKGYCEISDTIADFRRRINSIENQETYD